jgi:hypothetical protein
MVLKVGRLSRTDAAGLHKLHAAGAVRFDATLEITFSSRAPTIPTDNGRIELPEIMKNANVYINVSVHRVQGDGGGSSGSVGGGVPPQDWLNLAAALRCDLGVTRLRQVLAATGPWERHERKTFASVSASVGHDTSFAHK